MVLTPLQCCCSLWKPRNHYQIKGLVTDPAHRLLPGLNVVRQAVFEFNHKSIQRRVPIADRHRPLFVHALLRLDAATIQ